MKPRRILYYACHEILEYDDLRILTGLGHQVFSIGDFTYPNRETRFRRARPEFFQEQMLRHFHNTGCDHDKRKVTRDFAQSFDLIIINHFPEWYIENYDAFCGVPIVLRTIGQSTLTDEKKYKQFGDGMYLLRYSERERDLPGFAKTDGVIYFGKHKGDFFPYAGGERGVTFHNSYAGRGAISYPDFDDWVSISESAAIDLYGSGNEVIEGARGIIEPEKFSSIMSNAAFYQYVYTTPPSYTLSLIEALMAGVPIIAPSERYIRSKIESGNNGWWPDRYEVPSFLEGGAGIVFDHLEQAQGAARYLAGSEDLRRQMSRRALTAAEKFDARNIAPQWQDLIAQMTS